MSAEDEPYALVPMALVAPETFVAVVYPGVEESQTLVFAEASLIADGVCLISC
jgi:hypothetical protein